MRQSVNSGTNNFGAIQVGQPTVPLLGSLTLNAILTINDGDYFEATVVAGGLTPPSFNLEVYVGSLCVSFVSLI